jgi:hypothetical protein
MEKVVQEREEILSKTIKIDGNKRKARNLTNSTEIRY